MERVLAAVDINDAFLKDAKLPVYSSFADLVVAVVRNAFVLAGVISFILLVFGGFGVIVGAGSGDTKRIDQSKQTIIAAIIGLLIVVGSLFIIQVIETITGVTIIR